MSKKKDEIPVGPENWPTPASPDAWKDCVTEDYIECMICGHRGKLLTEPHIRGHGGSKRLYHVHFHIPVGTRLACLSLIRERRESMEKTGALQPKSSKSRIDDPPRDRNEDLASLLGLDGSDYARLDRAIAEGSRGFPLDEDF